MKNKILIMILLIILVIVFSFVLWDSTNNFLEDDIESDSYVKTNNINAIVTNIWIDESKFDNLKNHKIKYLFVDVGDTGKDGKLETSNEEIISFLDSVDSFEKENNYDFIILPYSEINTYNYDVDEGFENNFINDYLYLDSIGFDGIFVDIEPVTDRKGYLELLDKINKDFPSSSIIVVYSGSVGSETDNEWEWDLEFFREVSERVNLISVQGYDSDLSNKEEYQDYVKKQLVELSKISLSSNLMLGVPTHKDYPETIENSLTIYRETKSDFLGVAIFAEWTMDNEEWKVFDGYVL
ncbi:MAG: hypothetical protein ABIH37_03700 [archaeon]